MWNTEKHSRSWLLGVVLGSVSVAAARGSTASPPGAGGSAGGTGAVFGGAGRSGSGAAGGGPGGQDAGSLGGAGVAGAGAVMSTGGLAGAAAGGAGGLAGANVAGAGGSGGTAGAGGAGQASPSFCAAGTANCDHTTPHCETTVDAPNSCFPHDLGSYTPPTAYGVAKVALGPDGSYYLAGSFSQLTDFDPGPGMDLRVPKGMTDIYLVKLNPDASYAWTLTWGDPGSWMTPFRVSAAGVAVVLTGLFHDTVDVDPGPGTVMESSAQPGTFVVSLTTDGVLRWAGALEATSNCYAEGLAIDGAGDVYLGGNFTGICDLDPGPGVQNTAPAINFNNGFLVKLSGADGTRVWSKTLDTLTYNNAVRAAAVSPDGNVWLAGDFDLSPVITSFTPAGTVRFETALPIIGDSSGNARAIAAAADGSIYVGGDGAGTIDFDPGTSMALRTLQATSDDVSTFVLKLAADGSFRWVATWPLLNFLGLAASADGGVLVAVQEVEPSTTVDRKSPVLGKLASDGAPAWTFSSGGPFSYASDLAAGPTTFVVAGSTDPGGLPGDFDPGPGVDPAPPGVTYLSRFSS